MIKKLAGWLIAIVVPVFLLLSAVRLLLTPVFVSVEYRLPGFPEDSYGMTQEQRLHYAPLAVDYLLNDQGITFLGDQQFEDGTPLYNERELSHMYDVKNLTQAALKVWLGLLVVAVVVGLASWRFGWGATIARGLLRGGQLTILLIVTGLIFVGLSFNWLFTEFHHLFFQGDTWLFSYSDTLIRLFPLRFWQDAFIAVGALTLLGGAALWWGFRRANRR